MRWTENERLARWIVALAASLVYLNSLGNGFVFDDLLVVVQNPIVNQPRFLLYAFTTDYWRGTSVDLLYRPLTVFSYGLNHLVHGMHPFGFHLVNVVLHVFISLTIYQLIQHLFQKHRLSLMTALLFALHPIHTEAVTSIVGRAELLMSLFSLLALRYYLEARSAAMPQARHKFISCMLCYLLACLSKENGIAAPALLVLAEVTLSLQERTWDRFCGEHLRRAILCYVTLAAVGMAYFLIRLLVLGDVTVAHASADKFAVRGTLIGFPYFLQFANSLQFFARYAGLLLFPLWLSSDHSFDQLPIHASVWHWDIGVGAVLLVTLIGTALISARRAPPVFFGIGFFFLTFLPASNFIIPILTTLAERTMYLPSVGFLLVLAWVIARAFGEPGAVTKRSLASLTYAVLALLLTFYSARTILRNRDWHDEIALFSSAVRVSPHCGNAWNCLGDALADAGRYEEAIAAYDRSLVIIPDHGVFWFRKANTLLKWGHTDEAFDAYKKAIEHEPQLSDAADSLGRICVSRGNLEEALRWSLKAVAIQPTRAVFHFNLGYVFQRLHKPQEALRQYREAAALNPGEPSYAFNLGLVQRDLGEVDNALTNFQKAAELDPKNEKYWMTLADTALKKGALQPAAHALDEFVKVSTNATLVAKAKEILAQIRK